MAKEPDPQQANSTNALLASILNVAQDSNATLKLLLASSKSIEDSNSKLLAAQALSLAAINKLIEAIIGTDHLYTVKVTQLAKDIAAQLKK